MKKSVILSKIMWLLVVCVMLISLIVLPASASSEPTVASKSYEIAVAYDNSGSMYLSSGWYQAKYAMEIFASMMNLSGGDKLTIFPMHPVNTDGQSGTMKIEVKSTGDINKIHNMFTPVADGTPFTAVSDAYSHLNASKADEKWLIVLTDGEISIGNLQQSLESMASGKVKVQYIPFGADSKPLSDGNPGDNFFASPKVTTEDELQKELIDICNKIFKRDELKGRLKGNALSLDLSMKKLIVFVQGKGATVNSLKDGNGADIAKLMDSGKRTYSELGAGNYPNAKLPEEMKNQSGQVVTFSACPKGEYTLDCSSADSIQIFYEPDVKMTVELLNSDGLPEDFTDGEIPTGKYTYNVKILDKATGEDVTTHELMGGNVKIETTLTMDGKETKIENGGTVEFTACDDAKMDITATYLDRYTLSNKDDPSIFPFDGINFVAPVPKLNVAAKLTQGVEYLHMDRKNWKPIRLSLDIEGTPLTDDQLERAVLDIKFEGKTEDLKYYIETLPGESAANVYIGTDGKDASQKIKSDTYKMTASAQLDEGLREPLRGAANTQFKVKPFPFWIDIILILIAIFIAWTILGIPARPSKIYVVMGDESARKINRKSTIRVRMADDFSTENAFSAKTAVDYNLKSWYTFKNAFWKNLPFIRASGMSCHLKDIHSNVSDLSLEEDHDDKMLWHYKSVTWTENGVSVDATIYINKRK